MVILIDKSFWLHVFFFSFEILIQRTCDSFDFLMEFIFAIAHEARETKNQADIMKSKLLIIQNTNAQIFFVGKTIGLRTQFSSKFWTKKK